MGTVYNTFIKLVKYCHCDVEVATLIKLIVAEWRIYASVAKPSLVQIMACRLNGAKSLSEPMLEYC